ncbi:MAG: X-Pro dipeptidyl-peptidase [Bacteroidetes bacterium]|nr:CocE/NonD family hydrolase [Bacteroidia bacterium]PCH69744.1 MAG: X-Pro dipeptidyl-peptidase [Bacteroidota bacterium]
MKNARLFLSILALAVMFSGFNKSLNIDNKPKANKEDSLYVVENYFKREYKISMRDGIKLFTSVYAPKDDSKSYPILLFRTPYSLNPYGENNYKTKIGPSKAFIEDKYIFVFQDVRGKFMSEGEFDDMRPQITKENKYPIDESTDTYDSIDWLVKNVPNNNGKVGMWGISYPGFYAAVGAINAHPALKASSPQAPIADWYWDDFHHHGAFFLPHAFNFMSVFGPPRHKLTTKWPERFKHPTPDGYDFFLNHVGPLKNVTKKYYGDSINIWNQIVEHPNYDKFWQERNLLPHLQEIKPAILTVGGWFDAEDLYGPLKIYQNIEKNNPNINNSIVMGPWRHGGWNRTDGTKLGNVFFGDDPSSSKYYQENIELPFFNYHLKGKGELDLPEAYMFETGSNVWRKFNEWPPKSIESRNLYLNSNGTLSFEAPKDQNSYNEFISNPAKPVPFTEATAIGMTREYMTDDQRFASKRTDVLTYQTDILEWDMTLAGPLLVNLKISTSETASDWIVKLIDVYPDDFKNFKHNKRVTMAGYQQMVRSEVIRGRYRNSYENPEPFVPNQITAVDLELLDVLHTFKKGHRIMIQIQSTWFPLVDRNPQKYVDNIFKANEEDFIKATHRVYTSDKNSSFIKVGVLQ